MMRVLVVKANNRPSDQSVSAKMHDLFLEEIKNNEEITVDHVDLYNEELPYIGQDFLAAQFKSAESAPLTDAESKVLTIANSHLERFKQADVIVFAFPLWNFTVPAVLHTYMDYLFRAGETFRYTAEGPQGLMGDKRAILLNARGGDYSAPAMQGAEMSVNFIKNALGFFGIQQQTDVIIEGHNQYVDRSEEIKEEGFKRVVEAAKDLSAVAAR
ncbi:FMN-dependent NADH-azoreductase [Jeotgalibacillus sp. HH7-29]|uniref:FMN dependent NADH:quinone oxidoreductase n=2 Tax=Jeotgalibacillus haloalkalitolerans TaxID=3104292 RepID=A0ABU5KPU2_9BACL|nr:FMN-dependent NADH-azoreductase [Jeotgalibacillus sp. HH7-29]MDZ5713113.1 FMN-dependent NADH-azoreductase [Jeotgalibacillus sp. HH7-29]